MRYKKNKVNKISISLVQRMLKRLLCLQSMSAMVVVLCLVSLVAQLLVSNHLAIKGKELVELEYEKTSLQKEISELKLESSKYSSLSYIEGRAYDLGFVENKNPVALVKPDFTTASLSY